MRCTLLIPGLFWPRDTADAVLRGIELPALTKILAHAHAEQFPAITPEGWLCQAFEVERQRDWPIAPLTLEIDGGEAGDAYWLRADPVHIKVERDRLLLIDSALLQISSDEAHSLAAALNAHFAGDGISLSAPSPKRWYLRCAHTPDLVTRALSESAGNDVRSYLPTGKDALHWHGTFNEAQMLLHGHAVNTAREERGELAVNSVWFWGGGTRPTVRGRSFACVYSDDAAAIALAAAAGAYTAAVPGDADTWRRESANFCQGEAPQLVVLGELDTAIAYVDMEAWRERMKRLEAAWFYPLLAALRSGLLASLAIVAPAQEAGVCWRFDIGRVDLFRFWRSRKPLSAYA